MVIKALDYVPHCYTWDTGAVIGKIIRGSFSSGKAVTISFSGVTDTPSSFINAAFIALLNDYSFDYIKSNLKIIDCNRQIVDMIRRRFEFETSDKKAA